MYITSGSKKEAEKIAEHLLEKRLVACANIFPIESMYWWEGKIEKAGEYVSIVKTMPELWERVKDEVKRIHSYEVPCIMKIEVEANKEYEEWIRKEIEKR